VRALAATRAQALSPGTARRSARASSEAIRQVRVSTATATSSRRYATADVRSACVASIGNGDRWVYSERFNGADAGAVRHHGTRIRAPRHDRATAAVRRASSGVRDTKSLAQATCTAGIPRAPSSHSSPLSDDACRRRRALAIGAGTCRAVDGIGPFVRSPRVGDRHNPSRRSITGSRRCTRRRSPIHRGSSPSFEVRSQRSSLVAKKYCDTGTSWNATRDRCDVASSIAVVLRSVLHDCVIRGDARLSRLTVLDPASAGYW